MTSRSAVVGMSKTRRSLNPKGLLRAFGLATWLLASTTVSASACGSALLMHVMFRVWPETKAVSVSESKAIAEALLVAEKPPTNSAKLLHVWRTRKLEHTLARLSDHLLVRSGATRPQAKAAMLLINEFIWLEFEPPTSGVKITNRGIRTPDADTTLVFTTRRVLDSLLDRTVSWDQARSTDLLVVRGDGSEKAAWEQLFATIAKQQSARVVGGPAPQQSPAGSD